MIGATHCVISENICATERASAYSVDWPRQLPMRHRMPVQNVRSNCILGSDVFWYMVLKNGTPLSMETIIGRPPLIAAQRQHSRLYL